MKKVLITGGATGIGKACALLFKKSGYDVIATYNKTYPDYDGVRFEKCDISKVDDIESLFNRIGDIDILINNAGLSLIKMINDVTEEDYNQVMDVNFKGLYFISKYATISMLKKHSGSIINISSMWGQVGASCETLYSASKSAVIGFTKALAQELAPSSITVNCVCPGIIDTRMNEQFDVEDLIKEVPMNRLGTGEDIAKAVMYFAENDYVTGQVLGVNGGIC